MAQLVLQTAFPGDLLLSIPLLKQIRAFYPDEPLVLLCRTGLGEIFLREGLVDEVIEVNKKNKASFKATLRALRARKWKRVFCPHESYRSAFWVRSLQVEEFSVGFKKWWNFWAFTTRLEKPKHLPDALRQLSLLKINTEFRNLWGRDIDEAEWTNKRTRTDVSYLNDVKIPDWASMRSWSAWKSSNTVYIAPGSVWPTKRWTEEGFATLAKSLLAQKYDVIFVGSPAEQEICERLSAQTGAPSLAGKTSLYELVQRFKTGLVLISNDSGAMHSASVAGLPTVSVFGPTVLDFGFRPWQNAATVVQIDLGCRPCASHGGNKCPIGTHACMRDLPAATVERAFKELIGPK